MAKSKDPTPNSPGPRDRSRDRDRGRGTAPGPLTQLNQPSDDPFVGRVTLRKREAAQSLGVSERTVHSMIASGQLRAVKLGRVVLIPVEAIQAFIRSGPEKGGQA